MIFSSLALHIVPITNAFYCKLLERKRRVYDQYGKDGLLGHNERTHRSRRHDYEDFDFGFVFRSPDEVFREFFGVNSPFADLFGDGKQFFFHQSILFAVQLLIGSFLIERLRLWSTQWSPALTSTKQHIVNIIYEPIYGRVIDG